MESSETLLNSVSPGDWEERGSPNQTTHLPSMCWTLCYVAASSIIKRYPTLSNFQGVSHASLFQHVDKFKAWKRKEKDNQRTKLCGPLKTNRFLYELLWIKIHFLSHNNYITNWPRYRSDGLLWVLAILLFSDTSLLLDLVKQISQATELKDRQIYWSLFCDHPSAAL